MFSKYFSSVKTKGLILICLAPCAFVYTSAKCML